MRLRYQFPMQKKISLSLPDYLLHITSEFQYERNCAPLGVVDTARFSQSPKLEGGKGLFPW